MNVWKLTAAGNLVKQEEEPIPEEGKRRIRITKVFLNHEDGLLCKGRRKVKYPLVPGRFATGVISDEGSSLFPKGERVLLHSYLPAEIRGTEKRTFTEDDFRILGRTCDGFLRDFVYAREEELTLLPDSVNDDKALLLYHLALAQETVDALDVKRGEHIAVIGADILGLFTARLLIYRQAAPILIDMRKDRLDFARSRGVYYTSAADGSLMELVGTVTGGRLADGVVLVTDAGGGDLGLAVSVCAPEKHIVLCGPGEDSLPFDLSDVIKKRITLHGVSDGTSNLETAINLVANKSIDLSAFRFLPCNAEKLPALLDGLAEDPFRPIDEIAVVNML